MKKLLALLFALLATPAAAQTIPSGAWGSINYWGVGGLSQVLAPGLAGQCLTSQNVGSAPIWVNCQVSSLSLLPPISANSIMANNTLNFVAPQAIDVNRVLDMVGYDIIRPPVPESIIYKSNVGPNFNWQTLPPSTTGSILTSGGPTNPPFWATSAASGNLTAICTTVGALLYFDTPSLTWKCLNPGTSGQLLQTGGGAGNPSWLTVTLSTLGGVPSTRNVNTVAPLSGGGALSSDLTLTLTTSNGIDQNVLNAQTANYLAATSDCGGTIALGGNAQFTLTVGAASGFAATCSIVVQNTDGFASGRAKIMAINGVVFGNGSRLYPGQTFALKNENSTWVVTYAPGRWVWSNNKTINVDFALGADTNDGLAAGAGAYKNVNTAINDACNNFDVAGRKLTIQLADSPSYANAVTCDLPGAIPNNSGNGPLVTGNLTTPANVVLLGPSLTNTILGVNAHTGWMFQGMSLQQTGGNAALVESDINSLIYLGDKMVFANNGTTAQTLAALFDGKIEAQCPSGCAWTVGGAASFFLGADGGKFLNNGAITITIPVGAIFGSGVFNISRGATVEYANNITWSGPVTATTPPYICTSNAVLNTNGGAASIPSNGAAGTQTNGCAVDGTVTLNATNLTSGAVPAARMPALTGDVTTSVGTVATTLAAGNAGNLNSGTLLAARMPALTGDCTTSAGAVATTCTKINGVDQTTAWAAFTPSPSCGTATFTVNSARSKTMGKTTWVQADITITAIGAGCTVTNVLFNLPNTTQSSGGLIGRETTTNKGIDCFFFSAATQAQCLRTEATTWLVNDHMIVSGVYENQ